MGMYGPTPPAPIFDEQTFGRPLALRNRLSTDMQPPAPLPWLYRDPQRWVVPCALLVLLLIMGAAS